MQSATAADIQKLVSLTFDESPKVRKDAAKSLGAIDDPAAVFALIELSYDKDAGVKHAAQDILQKMKSTEAETMSFAELFSSRSKDQNTETQIVDEEKKRRILSPIEQLFEKKLGKEKADVVKKRMMPTIEKVYFKSLGKQPMTKENHDDINRQAMQEFLTSYLEAIAGIDAISGVQVHPAEPTPVSSAVSQKTPVQETLVVSESVNVLDDEVVESELDSVGTQEQEIDKITSEVKKIETEEVEEQKEEIAVEGLPQTFFKKAYETMMLSEGDDGIMKKELKRMLRETEHDAKMAFTLAKRKFKELKLTNITKIKDGMRNVNTDILDVKTVDHKQYPKGRSNETFTRVVVGDDDDGEAVVYLFDGRGSWLVRGMKIKVLKGNVKSFGFSGETALTIGKKGNVYIVL
ncbi:MAG: HEAT repeat domain-containing protein [Candidatus Micrarchaeota archaeon]